MKRLRVLGTAFAALMLSGCSGMEQREHGKDVTQQDSDVSATVLFIADPQIHNVQGGNVKQTLAISDWFGAVAQRHPEMNLLAPYALGNMIRQGVEQPVKAPAPFMVILGDATNAGCTGEFKRFMRAVDQSRGDRILLMAHGNHDSFLMGTINYWQEAWNGADMSAFQNAELPVDATWWTPADRPRGSGWRPLCYEPGESKSVPIHKVQWMAKYIDILRRPEAGLQVSPASTENNVRNFIGRGAPGSLLSKLEYRLEGAWIRPLATEGGMIDSYDSFLVQAINVGAHHRLILIDTSACAYFAAPRYRYPFRYWAQNAGVQGCLGKRQLDRIERLIDEERSSKRTPVFAGHFPLEDINEDERQRLMALMKKASDSPWTYLSAHTHKPKSILVTAGSDQEINLGSTTDWPMTAYQVQFGKTITAPSIAAAVSGDAVPAYKYSGPARFSFGAELCRHVDAAQMLSKWNVAAHDVYESPGKRKSYKECADSLAADSKDYEVRLASALALIDDRMAVKAYRDQMLGIMAAASRDESRKFSVYRLLDRFVP